ncbi:hypothetical protein NDN08_008258 [Rhodosorus marinus]|uniref:C2H2-type domain-containing protein n=1 Tax=Rhodosorus marinus TaxID=101924 RepID=A0AAV8UZZ3_9RHOD|nr:hypothetical protein NDN08_008258 [Rhodosorus marinus]
MEVLDEEGIGSSSDSLRASESESVLGLVPDESMKAWLLFEVESSNSLQFSQSILFQNLNSEPPENPGLNPIIQDWYGSNLYVPQEKHDGVVYGTVLGQMDSNAMLANQGTRTRFCFDCRGNELVIFIGGTDDTNGMGSLSKLVITEDGDLITSNTTFSVKNSSMALTATDMYDKKVCDFCESRGSPVCECSSALKSLTEDDLVGSFEAVRISMEQDSSESVFWTQELGTYTDKVFAGNFNISKVLKSSWGNEGFRTMMTQYRKEYAFHGYGDVVDTAREAFAFLHYSNMDYKHLTFPDSESWSVLDSDEQISNGVVIDELQHEFEAVSGEDETGPVPANEPGKEVRNFLCPACTSAFKRKYEMTRHFRTVHLGERGFSCEYCDKKFIHKTHLRTHVVSVHIGVSEAFCPSCGKGFATKAKLNRHVSAVHEKKRSHGCEVCGKKFFQRSDVKKHLKTHTSKLVNT